METNKSTEEEEIINTPYKELIGCLLFMSMNNLSNITYAIAYLSRFLDKPTISLWEASKRVLRYLKRTPVKGLNNRRTAEESSSIWRCRLGSRQSRQEMYQWMCSVLLRKSNTLVFNEANVTLSTAEAEYVVAAQSACGILKEYYKVLHLCH